MSNVCQGRQPSHLPRVATLHNNILEKREELDEERGAGEQTWEEFNSQCNPL